MRLAYQVNENGIGGNVKIAGRKQPGCFQENIISDYDVAPRWGAGGWWDLGTGIPGLHPGL